MRHISSQISAYYPNVKRVHVADNDTNKPEFGNTGVYECAESVKMNGGWVFVPIVKNGTDVCDLYNQEGLSELKRQIYESHDQYFNGQYSQNVAGLFNYIHV